MASNVPAGRLAKLRAVALATPTLVHAQSMAPTDAAVGAAPCTFGENTSVWLFRVVGIPLPAVAAKDTVIDQGVAAPITMLLTYFDCFCT